MKKIDLSIILNSISEGSTKHLIKTIATFDTINEKEVVDCIYGQYNNWKF